MRNFINKYGVIIVVVALLLAGGLYLWHLKGPRPENWGDSSLAFYVDEDTNEESIRSADEIPPLIGASGKPSIVRAMKFRGEGEKTAKTYYLLKYSPEAVAALQSLPKDDRRRPDIMSGGELVRLPGADNAWISSRDPQAESVISVPECGPGRPRRPVNPPKP